MGCDACIYILIYLLLSSYNNNSFFKSRKYILLKKMSLLTTTYLKAFTALRLLCSRLYKQVTTKLLQFEQCFLGNFNLISYLSV